MLRGATAIVTVLREEDRDVDQMEDQQFHMLPLYFPHCSKDELEKNVANGGLTILDKFPRTIAGTNPHQSDCFGAFKDTNLGGVAFVTQTINIAAGHFPYVFTIILYVF